uniref:Anti-FecI sigma factor FecR n=1 Tax=uncultured bacterium 4C6 TaxID=1701323 RepID=A0A0N9HH09_9BACT|nr:anti-FecI sigma factor FecR [uncultured bacterium 4C6]
MVEPRFVELLTKELTEGLTVAERQELDHLLQQNPVHKKQSAIIKEYWKSDSTGYKASAANFEKVMEGINAAEQNAAAGDVSDNENKSIKLWPVLKCLAAVLILGVTLYLWLISANTDNKNIKAQNWNTKITAPGIKTRLVLSDGTTVTLNSATTFKYPVQFDGKTREVYLNGEAYFDVHKDKKHPFIIHTNKMNVRVLGTVFNIKSYDNESRSETSLIHGSIEVTLSDRKADRIILKPSEKLIVQNNSAQKQTNISTGKNKLNTAVTGTQYSLTNLTYFPSVDSAAVETLWLKNKLVFRNNNFESIATDMERWYGIKIVFEHEELKKLRFTATFERETATEALESLRFTDDFRYKKKGSIFYIFK